MYTTMLCVRPSLARKSNASGRPRLVCGPSEMTEEKPTPLLAAQSRIDAVNAPDWLTRASGPSLARGPITPALSCKCGRWMPKELGPSR